MIISSNSESLLYLFQKKIDHISIRIKAINKSYKQISNIHLKFRLLKEYESLKLNFFEIKSLIKLTDQSYSNQLRISTLLNEKCNRCESEIFKNKYLFSA